MSYDYMLPLVLLGLGFCSTTCICEILHQTQPKWYRKRIITYPTDKKDKVRKHEALHLVPIVLRNIAFAGVWMVMIWELRLYVFGDLAFTPSTYFPPHAIYQTIGGVLDLIVVEKISQIWFFHAHYIVHKIPFLYRHIHKMHHEHTEPSVLTAIHCTIGEMILLNLPAVYLGPLIVLPSLPVHILWYILASIYTPVVHSGYDLIPWIEASYHDRHHRTLKYNFGSRLLDTLYGTAFTGNTCLTIQTNEICGKQFPDEICSRECSNEIVQTLFE